MTPIAKKLLRWFQKHRISYPWRKSKDPYKVWLSEILLQQTRIPVALDYYQRILTQYPTLTAMARANENTFLSLWSGIGYYSRARNMLKCARKVAHLPSQRFPKNFQALTKLPGIGPYTAGAIRNICFGLLTPAIDGNVRRVLSRITNNHDSPATKEFQASMEEIFLKMGTGSPPGDYFQALMELGQRICLPLPTCRNCPVRSHCLAYQEGTAADIPVRRKQNESVRLIWYLLLLQKGRSTYYVQNPSRDFLKDAWIFPDILCRRKLGSDAIQERFKAEWGIGIPPTLPKLTFSHSVTFRKLQVQLVIPESFQIRKRNGRWLADKQARAFHTSSVTFKVRKAIEKI